MPDAQQSKSTPTRGEREPFLPVALVTLAAPLLWVLHFALLYLLEGFLCARAQSAAMLIPAAIALATLFCGGACLYLFLCLRRTGAVLLQSQGFLAAAQRLLAGLALTAIAWESGGAFFLDICAFAY